MTRWWLVHPAPDAGTTRVVPTTAVYNHKFDHPTEGSHA